MTLWSNIDANTAAPKYTVDIVNGLTGIQAYNATPVGTYAYNKANTISGVTSSGWSLKTVGTGNRTGRVFNETLVSISSIGETPSSNNPKISITTQPSNTSVTVSNNATFSVAASSDGDTVVSYQWYYASPARSNVFMSIGGATSNTYIKANARLTDSNTLYKVVVSGTNGVNDITSNVVTLLVS